jgi:hypothetical protein
MKQRDRIVDVDTIPSLQDKPVSAMLVEEEVQVPIMAYMDMDFHDSV